MKLWRRDKSEVPLPQAGSWGMPPSSPGKWRFSRLDGRFTFDYDDGRKGFHSPTFCGPDEFAKYVNEEKP